MDDHNSIQCPWVNTSRPWQPTHLVVRFKLGVNGLLQHLGRGLLAGDHDFGVRETAGGNELMKLLNMLNGPLARSEGGVEQKKRMPVMAALKKAHLRLCSLAKNAVKEIVKRCIAGAITAQGLASDPDDGKSSGANLLQ